MRKTSAIWASIWCCLIINLVNFAKAQESVPLEPLWPRDFDECVQLKVQANQFLRALSKTHSDCFNRAMSQSDVTSVRIGRASESCIESTPRQCVAVAENYCDNKARYERAADRCSTRVREYKKQAATGRGQSGFYSDAQLEALYSVQSIVNSLYRSVPKPKIYDRMFSLSIEGVLQIHKKSADELSSALGQYDEFIARAAADFPASQPSSVAVARASAQNNSEKTFGRIEFGVGAIYEGEILDGRPHGRGILKRATTGELIYEGGWRNGKQSGFGRFEQSNGSWYEGEFLGGLRHGRGAHESANGDSFEGTFESNRMWNGVLTEADGTQKRFVDGQVVEQKRDQAINAAADAADTPTEKARFFSDCLIKQPTFAGSTQYELFNNCPAAVSALVKHPYGHTEKKCNIIGRSPQTPIFTFRCYDGGCNYEWWVCEMGPACRREILEIARQQGDCLSEDYYQ